MASMWSPCVWQWIDHEAGCTGRKFTGLGARGSRTSITVMPPLKMWQT